MTWQRMAQIGLELAVCAVHPVPGKYNFIWTTKMANHGGYLKTEVKSTEMIICLSSLSKKTSEKKKSKTSCCTLSNFRKCQSTSH
jgi:hypothetical protein